jgi:hypothetical protein
MKRGGPGKEKESQIVLRSQPNDDILRVSVGLAGEITDYNS